MGVIEVPELWAVSQWSLCQLLPVMRPVRILQLLLHEGIWGNPFLSAWCSCGSGLSSATVLCCSSM